MLIEDMTLTDILTILGYYHCPTYSDYQGRDVFHHNGDYVGRMSCFRCFEWLRATGQINF